MYLNTTLPLIFKILFIGLTISAGAQNQGSQSQKPNIVIILPDDLGWNDVGYQGSFIRTPHLDRLAAGGAIMTQHYVMPSCTPSRVSLITGKYPSRYGILSPAYGEVIDQGDPTLASLLQDMGYFTAITGKWHMGSPPHTPLKYGFESSYGYLDGQIDPYTHEYKRESKFTSFRSWHRNDQYLDEKGHATDLITDEAVRIIKGDRDQPFFLYVAYSVPHYPLSEPEEWTSMYDEYQIEESRKWYAASVSHMDDGIGKILEALDQTGQRENTLVIFVSDNGGQNSWYSDTDYQGAYADKPHDVLGNNFPLRGWKVDLYEGGIRVPAVVNWPGVIDRGLEVNTPVHIADWLPTLIRLVDGESRLQNIRLDGKDIWSLFDKNLPHYEPHPFYWRVNDGSAVREGDWKLIAWESGKKELYNLKEDFRETTDLSEKNPEMVQKLMGMMEGFRKDDR